MDGKLTEVLETIGNTPIAEPELYALINKQGVKVSQVAKKVLEKNDLRMKDFSANDVGEFIRTAIEKIISFKDKDGVYKSTQATEDCDLPDFEQAERLTELLQKYWKAKGGLEGSALEKELKSIQKAEDAIIWDEVCGLNREDLTEWEQNLVSEQVKASAYDAIKTAFGNSLKN